MEKERCSLCESKLVKGKCVRCGMDFNKKGDFFSQIEETKMKEEKFSSSYEKMKNESKSDSTMRSNGPVRSSRTEYSSSTVQKSNMQKSRPQKKGQRNILLTILSVSVVVIGLIFSMINERVTNVRITNDSPAELYDKEFGQTDDYSTYGQEDYDPYAYTTREFAEGGESYSAQLESGDYVVGKQIPEGKYTVTVDSGYGWFDLEDSENNIYLSDSLSTVESEYSFSEVEDVRLFEGAVLKVQTGTKLVFTSENAQIKELSKGQSNPLTEEIIVEDGMIAGIDFPEGTYDVQLLKGDGSIEINSDESETYYYRYLFMAENDYSENYYRNVPFTKGISIKVQGEYSSEDFAVKLVPSETIYP